MIWKEPKSFRNDTSGIHERAFGDALLWMSVCLKYLHEEGETIVTSDPTWLWIRMDSGNDDDHVDHYFMIVIAIIIIISTSRSGSTSFFVCTLHGKSATVELVITSMIIDYDCDCGKADKADYKSFL